jgi:hypothetical protein
MEKDTFWAIDTFILKLFIILQNAYNLLQFPLYIFLASKIIKGNTGGFFCWYKLCPGGKEVRNWTPSASFRGGGGGWGNQNSHKTIKIFHDLISKM